MRRRTKIVATLGPSSKSEQRLTALIEAGADVVRLNFSHGSAREHKARTILVRKISKKINKSVAILGDLQGPKIRIGCFKNEKVFLKKDDQFILDTNFDMHSGNEHQVGISYKKLPQDCSVNDVLLLDDGYISLKVLAIEKEKVITTVLDGGVLSNNKGLNLAGGGLSADALTQKDKEDIVIAAEMDVDFLAVSFVRRPEDIIQTRDLLTKAGGNAGILAKIERAEVINDKNLLNSIIKISDGIMVARGDLGVEIGDAELIGVQKKLIHRARRLNKPVITATQMMESMIHNTRPTRAEVFDVANAVLDGTDAVMLSAETATGNCPEGVVSEMAKICVGAEKNLKMIARFDTTNEIQFHNKDEAIALTAAYTANRLHVRAVVCLTKSGITPLWVSRINSKLPIIALTRYESTKRRVSLYRGVEAVDFDSGSKYGIEISGRALEELKKRGFLNPGDLIVLTKGEAGEVTGGTNTMQILTVS